MPNRKNIFTLELEDFIYADIEYMEKDTEFSFL